MGDDAGTSVGQADPGDAAKGCWGGARRFGRCWAGGEGGRLGTGRWRGACVGGRLGGLELRGGCVAGKLSFEASPEWTRGGLE